MGCPGGACPLRPATWKPSKFNLSVRFGAVWCALVRSGALGTDLSRMESPFSSLKSGFISRISYILRLRIVFPVSPLVVSAPCWFKPGFRAQLEMIPGFLASLFHFLIGFPIPLCLCHLCAAPKLGAKMGQKVPKGAKKGHMASIIQKSTPEKTPVFGPKRGQFFTLHTLHNSQTSSNVVHACGM